MNNPLAAILNNYFYLRQRIPIFIYVFYIHFKESDNPAIRGAIKTIVSLMGLVFIYALIGLVRNEAFTNIIPLGWNYSGLMTWLIFFVCYYLITLKIMHNNLMAFTFAVLATIGGGWLYEIWFFHPWEMFVSNNTIFLFNSQILCLILLAYELRKVGFKLNRNIYFAFSVFLFFSIALFSDFYGVAYQFKIRLNNSYIFSWFYRIPACNFLISLLGGIRKNEA